ADRVEAVETLGAVPAHSAPPPSDGLSSAAPEVDTSDFDETDFIESDLDESDLDESDLDEPDLDAPQLDESNLDEPELDVPPVAAPPHVPRRDPASTPDLREW